MRALPSLLFTLATGSPVWAHYLAIAVLPWAQGVGGSNPLAPTKNQRHALWVQPRGPRPYQTTKGAAVPPCSRSR